MKPRAVAVVEVLDEAEKLVPELLDLLHRRTGTDPHVAVAALVMTAHVILEATSRNRITGPKERERFRRGAACVVAHAGERAQSKLSVILPRLLTKQREAADRARR